MERRRAVLEERHEGEDGEPRSGVRGEALLCNYS